MKTYAQIQDGIVIDVIDPILDDSGKEIPIEERYTTGYVSTLVDVTDVSPRPGQGWNYDGSSFSEPVPYQPSPAEISAANTAVRDALLSTATLAIAPLQDAVDLNEATEEEASLLKKWKQYRVAVNRADLTRQNPAWPSMPAT